MYYIHTEFASSVRYRIIIFDSDYGKPHSDNRVKYNRIGTFLMIFFHFNIIYTIPNY